MNIKWRHVKGHSGDKWNDRADALAKEGIQKEEAGTAAANPQAKRREATIQAHNVSNARRQQDTTVPLQ